jgi:hypothetical protein
MNMVRTGVVRHPSEWAFGGYTAIQNPKQRYSIAPMTVKLFSKANGTGEIKEA